jgi:hypothetical protein
MNVIHVERWPRSATVGVAAAGAMLMTLMTAGCQQRFAGESRPTAVMESQPLETAVMSAAEQREVTRVLRELARDHQPSLDREPLPITWPDVRRIVAMACSANEMAIARVVSIDDETRIFHIRTLDERPATLTVRRIQPDDDLPLDMYDAEATVGLFEDDFDRAQRLVEAFNAEVTWLRHQRMRDVGR